MLIAESGFLAKRFVSTGGTDSSCSDPSTEGIESSLALDSSSSFPPVELRSGDSIEDLSSENKFAIRDVDELLTSLELRRAFCDHTEHGYAG